MSQRQVAFSPHELIFDKKFDVALRLSHASLVYKKFTQDKCDLDEKILYKACKYAHMNSNYDVWQVNYHVFPEIFLSCLDAPLAARADKDIMTMINVMSSVMECQLEWNQSCLKPSLRGDSKSFVDEMRQKIHSSNVIHKLVSAKKCLDELVRKMPVADSPRKKDETQEDYIKRIGAASHFESKDLGLKIAWSRRSCLISTPSHVVLLPRSYILLIHNKIMDILSVFVYAACIPDSVYDVCLLRTTEVFIRQWMLLAMTLQQKFFHLSKVLEGICIGESLYEVEGDGNRQFLRTIEDGLLELTGFRYEGSMLCELIRTAPLAVKHEISCLSKVAGHPFVDMELTAETLREKVNEEKKISVSHIERAKLYATEDFIRQYRKEHGSWPPVQFEEGCNESLVKAKEMNSDPRNVTHQKLYGVITIQDYALVTIKPCLEFDWVDNFLPFVKDRTISFLKEDVLKTYFPELTSVDPDYRPNWSMTRALLAYLLYTNEVTDHKQYVKDYNEGNWDLCSAYLVIRLVPKEREHKIAARAFGAKTAQERARSIIQELNVARFLDKYSKEHVMTQGEIEVAQKLLGFRYLNRAYQGYTMLIMQVDASTWNSRFRHAAVGPIAAKVLDSAYDVHIFEKTQTAFEMSFIYMPDGEKNRYWEGQLGGIEGLQQYTWVFVYIHHIKVCMEEHPYPFYILCKGDDLRIAIMVPPQVLEHVNIDELKQRILASLADEAAKMGHVLKVEDSYASECYFAYSKNTFVNNVEQPQTYRKIQKCHGANNAFLSTIDDYVGTAFSNAHSAAKTSPSPLSCYAVAIFWATLHLLERPDYRALNETEIAGLLQVPNLLGGLPIIFLHNFFVRAESDLLPPFLDLKDFVVSRYPAIGRIMQKFLSQVVTSPRKSFGGLMADPYSLPLEKPQAVSTILRQEVTKLLQNIVENENVKQLFIISKGPFDRHFLDVLYSADVWNVKLLSACYNCGPNAIVAELIRKFESGRSIYNLLLIKKGRRHANRVLSKCLRTEKKLCDFRFQVIRRTLSGSRMIDDYEDKTCSWKRAQHMRTALWKHEIHGVSQPCVQHQIIVGDQQEFDHDDYTGQHHFKLSYDPPPQEARSPLFTIGAYLPYVGAATGSGLGKPEARIPIENVITPKVRTLMQLYQWGHATRKVGDKSIISNFPVVVQQLLETYTKASIEHLMPFVGSTVRGRTIQHHVRSSNYKETIVPNTLLNLYTRTASNRHSHNFFSASPDHYLVNFLHVNCMMTSYVGMRMWMGQQSTRSREVWGVTTSCKYCTSPIIEPAMILESTILPSIQIGENFLIGQKAIREIVKAIEEFRPSDYYLADESAFASEEAESCLIQHVMNKSWRRHTLLREETQHVLNAEGEEALASYGGYRATKEEEECYAVADIEHFLHDLAFMIYWDILCRYEQDSISGVSTSIANTPPSELPWTSVLRGLDKHRRFNSFQRVIRRVFRMYDSPVVDRPEALSAIFGQKCYEYYVSFWKGSPLIANMGASSDPRVREDIVQRVYATRFSYLDKVFTLGITQDSLVGDEMTKLLVAISLVSGSELVFGGSGLSNDREVIQLFPLLTDIDEEISCFDYKDALYIADDEEEVLYEQYVLPRFTQMCFFRYQVDLFAAHSLVKFFCEEPLKYIEAHTKCLDLLGGNAEITILRANEATCLSKVRSNLSFGGLGPLMKISAPRSSLKQIKVKRPYYKVKHFRAEQCFTYVPVEVQLCPELLNFPLTTLLNNRALMRPIGAGNISMSKLGYLLNQIGVKGLPIHCNIACLGDGYGGFTAVFAALGDGTTNIVYNTTPARDNSLPECIVANEVSKRRNVTILDQLILQEYTDLSKSSTCERIEEHVASYNIVTLDAEVPARKIETPSQTCERLTIRRDMFLNVCTMYIRKATEGSLLIMKVYIHETYEWLPCLARLVPWCTEVYVVRGHASASDGELYIVAQCNKSQDIPYNSMVMYPPARTFLSLAEMYRTYVKRHEEDEGRTDALLCKVSYPKIIRALLTELPIFGWTKMAELCKLVVPVSLVRCQSRNIHEWVMEVQTYLCRTSAACFLELNGCIPNIDAEVYSTLAHCLVVSYRFITLRAFLFVAMKYEHSLTPTVKQSEAEDAFLMCMAEFPDHLRLPVTLEGYLENNGVLDLYGSRFLPLPYWMQGLRWSVSAYPASLVGGFTPEEDGSHEFVYMT